MKQDNTKLELAVLQAHSVRDLVDSVNQINRSSETKICKEDIVDILKIDDAFFLLYYR